MKKRYQPGVQPLRVHALIALCLLAVMGFVSPLLVQCEALDHRGVEFVGSACCSPVPADRDQATTASKAAAWHCADECFDTPYLGRLDWLVTGSQHGDDMAVAPVAVAWTVVPRTASYGAARMEVAAIDATDPARLSTVFLI